MVLSQNYEIVDIAEETLAVPVGEMAEKSKDVFSFSRAGGFLLNQLKKPKTEEEMIDCIIKEFDVDFETAKSDVQAFISAIRSYGLIVD